MNRKWKMCVAWCLILILLAVPVQAGAVQTGEAVAGHEITAPRKQMEDVMYIDKAASERADSDGDADVPLFWQGNVNLFGVEPNQVLSPDTAKVSDVVTMIRPIIYRNEVGSNWEKKYGSVTRNDNGHGISAGILQWNATNALNLLKAIIEKAPENAQTILGVDLYNKILTDTSWDGTDNSKRFIPTEKEATVIGQLLASEAGKTVQNSTADVYIYEYITLGFSTYGITNAAALAYFCDLKNQCGMTTVKRIVTRAMDMAGQGSAVTLNELHQAALIDSIAGNYQNRRYLTYQSVADVAEKSAWNYYPPGGYRIPSNTVGLNSSGSEIMWLQTMLNTVDEAGIQADGIYGINTQEAVRAFQTKYQSVYGIEPDGYAGRQTITALIQVQYSGEIVESPVSSLAAIVPVLNGAVNTSNGVEITWEPVEGASGYYVYRKLSGEQSYQNIGQISSAKTVTYTDKAVKSGKTYVYTVRAYNSAGMSSFVVEGTSIYYLQAPRMNKAEIVKIGTKISWKKVAGAGGYYVYRKAKNGAFRKVATIKSGSKVKYYDRKGKANKKYTYIVAAYKGTTQSAYSAEVSKKYVKLLKYKTKSNLNYRSGPGTTYEKKGTLKGGKTVYVVKGAGKKADGYRWSKIFIDKKYYYVARKYLKKM